VKRREEDILQKVQTMLSSQPSQQSSDIKSNKQRKKEQVLSSNKLPLITRSADSKFKNNLHGEDSSLLRPKSGPDGGLMYPTDSPIPSPVKQLDLQKVTKQSVPILSQEKKFPAAALVSPTPKQRGAGGDLMNDHSYSPISQIVSNDPQDDSSVGKNSVIDSDTALSSLSLSYVHGYDGDCTRNGGIKTSGGKNLFWLSAEVIIYPAATLVVLMNIRTGKQSYYRSHTDEVSALTTHTTRSGNHLIASGQMGKDSRLLIWESQFLLPQDDKDPTSSPTGGRGGKYSPRYDNNTALPPLDPSFHFHREIFLREKTRGVMALSFSPDGALLLALGYEETKPIFIFDWMKNECLATTKLGHIDLYQIGFNPYLYIPPVKGGQVIPGGGVPVSYSDDGTTAVSSTETPNNRINFTKSPLEDNICCYSLVTTLTRGVKFWTLRQIKERSDVVALASNGSQFKGRKIAIPKHKQSWSWKYLLEGNIGLFPKKNNHTPPDMMCYSILPDDGLESEPGSGQVSGRRLPRSKILTGGSNGSVYIWQQLEAGVEDTSREDYVPQYWLPRGRLLCVITGVHEGPLLDLDLNLTPISVNQQMKYLLATSGRDGILNLWELDSQKTSSSDALPLDHVTALNVSNHSPIIGTPRSIQWCGGGHDTSHNLIIGTTGNTICLVRRHGPGTSNTPTGTATVTESHTQTHSSTDQQLHGDLRLDIVMTSHVGRITRIVPHPTQHIFVTIGTDKSIRLWSMRWRKQVAFTRVASNPTSVTFIPDGSSITIGTEVGEVLILTCTYLQKILETGEELKHLSRKRVKWDLLGKKFIGTKGKGKEQNPNGGGGGGGAVGGGGGGGGKQKSTQSCELTEMKYSPDGEYLAVASRDKSIHILSIQVSSFSSITNQLILSLTEWL
jgi:WD40 repeat protein